MQGVVLLQNSRQSTVAARTEFMNKIIESICFEFYRRYDKQIKKERRNINEKSIMLVINYVDNDNFYSGNGE